MAIPSYRSNITYNTIKNWRGANLIIKMIIFCLEDMLQYLHSYHCVRIVILRYVILYFIIIYYAILYYIILYYIILYYTILHYIT